MYHMLVMMTPNHRADPDVQVNLFTKMPYYAILYYTNMPQHVMEFIEFFSVIVYNTVFAKPYFPTDNIQSKAVISMFSVEQVLIHDR